MVIVFLKIPSCCLLVSVAWTSTAISRESYDIIAILLTTLPPKFDGQLPLADFTPSRHQRRRHLPLLCGRISFHEAGTQRLAQSALLDFMEKHSA
jgi:hypothetical protein